MGRPLNKKYFGNRNIGSASTTADDKIGGEGVASIDNPVPGSIIISNTYKHFPTLTVAAPGLPGGVTALTATTWEIESIVWGVMTPKIKISPNPSKVSARDLAAMDLWVFLISVKQGAWPYDPPVARLVRPSPEHTTCEGNLEFLSNMFKGLLDSYRVAQD